MEFALFKFCPLAGSAPCTLCANTETEPTEVCGVACVGCFVPTEEMPAHPLGLIWAEHVHCKGRAEEKARRAKEAKATKGKKGGKA